MVDAVNDAGARRQSGRDAGAEKSASAAFIHAQRVSRSGASALYAGIIAGSRVSEAKIPALREQCNGLLLQGPVADALFAYQRAGRRLSF